MLIFATSISGSGRKEYLNNFIDFAKKSGKKVKVYFVGEMLFEQAKRIGINITMENVLNANPGVINALRSAVFEEITANLPKDLKNNDAVILSIHSFFYWRKVFRRAYDHFYLGQLRPDLFVTFIDNHPVILDRLNQRAQWRPEKLTAHEILLWQNVEVELTASLAEFSQKKFFVLSCSQPLKTLYKLVFYPQMEPVYISMPITHIKSSKSMKMIDKFIDRLECYFTVFDPRTIETGAVDTKSRKKDELTVHHHTVARDLYWLLKQSKKIIAYFPEIVSSPGVINELREAFETNKDTWVVYPEKFTSPFLTYFCNKLFKNEEDFFNFLNNEAKIPKVKDKKFCHY